MALAAQGCSATLAAEGIYWGQSAFAGKSNSTSAVSAASEYGFPSFQTVAVNYARDCHHVG